MNRRTFMCGIGGFVAGFPAICHAQSRQSSPAWGGWRKIPSIVVVSAENDPRLPALREAVDFWNAEFSKLGTPFRLGAITHIAEILSVDDLRPFANAPNPALEYLRQSYNLTTRSFDLPESFRQFNGDLIVALSEGELTSVSLGSL